ncbi:sugar kinase [Microbacterium sp. Kw_RZR3]|jgi:2-dehydro-3-deoxygluconokinase|uniref:sugar kinase n=1 Tax=unclassified Microbacterium TaxID=2609290 RepID=UPI0023DACDD1|nr:sugar kinase [Microbacterium sp. Kw_RZR3]MDF2047205.1 sugar kinase [Microbacterium sp. Kw_RZR3]
MSRVVTLGESMGLVLGAGVGGWEHQSQAHVATGGAEGNTAIGLARLGIPVTWLGRVGDDALGRRVVGDLRSEGVEVRALVDTGAPTGLMLKSTPRAGATTVDYYRRGSAGSRLEAADLDGLPLSAGDILHVTGVTLALSESARDAVVVAVDRARAAGALVSFAVNHRSRLWAHAEAVAAYAHVIARADIVFASDDEARMLHAHTAPEDLARALAAAGPAEAVVTLGGDGAVAVVDGDLHRVAAVPITPVDTVGAGDAFAAGYLSERLLGGDAATRLRTASLAGAYACLHPGDWQGGIRRSELDGAASADPVTR